MTTLINMFNEDIHNDSFVVVTKHIEKLSNGIKKYQEKSKSYIERNSEQFLPNLTSNELLLNEGNQLIKKVEVLLQQIKDDSQYAAFSTNKEVKQYLENFEEIFLALKTTYKILKIDQFFQCLEDAKSKQEFIIVLELVRKIKKLVTDQEDKTLSQLKCFKNIKIQYRIEFENVLHIFKHCFEQLVEFKEKTLENSKTITLKISKDENRLTDIINALFSANYNPKKFCEFLMINVFEPILTKSVSLDFNDDCSDEYVELLLSFSVEESLTGIISKTNYKSVFENICAVITCLGYVNVQLNHSVCVMGIFSGYLRSNFLNLLINECLVHAIPKSIEEMQASTLMEDVIRFNKFLSDVNFIDCAIHKDLIIFTENINVLFRNRFTKKILDDTIDIINKELYDVILVSEKNNSTNIENDPFLFPQCMISKSVVELTSIIKSIVENIYLGSEEKSVRLTVISSIIEQYMIEVPRNHDKMLNIVPQQTAIFYNNCMYISHWLSKNCKSDIQDFQILMQSLQNLGKEYFANQVKMQHKQLCDTLKQFDCVSNTETRPQTVIRRCIHQIDFLKNVWQSILPNAFYVKQISALLNDFCNELIRKIMIIDKISTAVSNQIVEILSIVEDGIPLVFAGKNSVLEVKLWMKLMQLKKIMVASLSEIVEQWSEGKGHLSLNFKTEEIKHLIRALFQNTERRANALALIV